MDLDGKVSLVTGAARRVGRAIAVELARAGSDVVVHYHTSAKEAAETVDAVVALGRRGIAVPGDLAVAGSWGTVVEETVRQLGRLDVLVNNASVFEAQDTQDWSEDHWARTLLVNAVAPAMLAQAAARYMRQAGAGRIVNLVDILADRPIRRFAAYCASKAALVSVTRSLARELAPLITVNAIAPGIAAFPESYDQALRDKLTRPVPLQRPGTPGDIARAVSFLVGAGDYITGQVMTVDGGRSIVP